MRIEDEAIEDEAIVFQETDETDKTPNNPTCSSSAESRPIPPAPCKMAPIRMQSSRQLPLAVAFLLVSTAASFTAPSEFVFAGMFPRAGWDVGEICTASAVIVSAF
jgi:hypothetical protein